MFHLHLLCSERIRSKGGALARAVHSADFSINLLQLLKRHNDDFVVGCREEYQIDNALAFHADTFRTLDREGCLPRHIPTMSHHSWCAFCIRLSSSSPLF